MYSVRSGSSAIPTMLRRPAPHAGRRSSRFGPGHGDHQDRHVAAPIEQVVDEVEQAAVGGMEVLEHQDRGARGGDPLEEGAPGREELVATARHLADSQQGQQGGLDPAPVGLIGYPLGQR